MLDMRMRFNDFIFPSNPERIEVFASTNLKSSAVLNKNSEVSNISVNPIIVKGAGEFYGERALEYCLQLQHFLKQKRSGILLLPSESGFNMYLTEFAFERNAKKNCVTYSFKFTEDCGDKSEHRAFYKTTALDGENAFDIADRCGVSVDIIMQKNGFKSPFDIKSGDCVVLR